MEIVVFGNHMLGRLDPLDSRYTPGGISQRLAFVLSDSDQKFISSFRDALPRRLAFVLSDYDQYCISLSKARSSRYNVISQSWAQYPLMHIKANTNSQAGSIVWVQCSHMLRVLFMLQPSGKSRSLPGWAEPQTIEPFRCQRHHCFKLSLAHQTITFSVTTSYSCFLPRCFGSVYQSSLSHDCSMFLKLYATRVSNNRPSLKI